MIQLKLMIMIVCFIGLAKGWGQEPLFLSLKQAEDLAIQNSYQLNASLHRLEQGYYDYRISQAYFKPKLTFSAEDNLTKEQHGLDSALRLTQPVFDQVAVYLLKASQIQWEILRLEVQQLICDILFEVRQAYCAILLSQAHLAVDQIVIQLWEEEVKRQEQVLKLGALTSFELNQTKLQLKGAWGDYHATQSEVRSSQIKLLTILGLSSATVLYLVDHDNSVCFRDWHSYSAEQYKQWALQYHPQLKQKQWIWLLSQNKIAQTKAKTMPTVNLYANAGHRYINDGFNNQPYIGVGLSVDGLLYDPTKQHRIKQAEEEVQEAAANYYQLEREIASNIEELLNVMDQSYLAYLNAQERVILAEEGVRMVTTKYQIGMISAFEYRNAIITLHEAQLQINQAKFDACQAFNQLLQQTGLDLVEKQKLNGLERQ